MLMLPEAARQEAQTPAPDRGVPATVIVIGMCFASDHWHSAAVT
jgi:hypothetical protein